MIIIKIACKHSLLAEKTVRLYETHLETALWSRSNDVWTCVFETVLESPLWIRWINVFKLACTCKCDNFSLHWCLPLFVLSVVNKMSFRIFIFAFKSSGLHLCVVVFLFLLFFSGSIRHMAERAVLWIKGLKMRSYSNADYVDDQKKYR